MISVIYRKCDKKWLQIEIKKLKTYKIKYRIRFLTWNILTWSCKLATEQNISKLYLCACVCLSHFTANISLTMGRILIKLGKHVGTLVRLIVLKFEHSAAREKPLMRGNFFFFFFFCIFMRFRAIRVDWDTLFLCENFEHSAA